MPTYRYVFDYVAQSLPDQPGAGHATDIPFFFGTQAIKYGKATSPRDNATGRLISRYVVNFATTGNPNGADLPDWPRYGSASGQIARFAVGTIVLDRDEKALR